MVIERRPLRDKVREEVLERLLRGVLPVGTNINEPELARELGVSRTPLREALLSLEREGLLDTHPGRGWWVAPLTPETVLDVYPIVGTLEALAVRLTPPETFPALVDELDRINASRLDVADDPAAGRAVDDAWHDLLTSGYRNRRLRETVAALKRIVVHRYEYAFMQAGRDVERSVRQHAAVTKALRDGDLTAAAAAIEAHWASGAADVAAWLETEGTPTPGTT